MVDTQYNHKKKLLIFKRDDDSIGDETEDEEVKFNCIGALRGYQDSDFGSDSETDTECNGMTTNEEQKEDGVVNFSCGNLARRSFLLKPKAERLPPHHEESSDSDGDMTQPSTKLVDEGGPAKRFTLDNGHGNGGNQKDCDSSEEDANSDEKAFYEKINHASQSSEATKIRPKQNALQKVPPIQRASTTGQAQAKAKRVLSSNTLASLNAEAGHKEESPKRFRGEADTYLRVMNIPEFSLGLPAMDDMHGSRDSPVFSSDDDDDLDRTLSEELRRFSRTGGDKSPVPLLTPVQSPITIPAGDSIEWPSNLVVDSAMMLAASFIRPLSPSSLQKLEEDEEARLNDAYSHPHPSSLTPLLRSIYVGID